MKQKLPLFVPEIGSDEIKGLTSLLKSKDICKNKKKAEFESKFAKTVGMKYGIATNSENYAVHIAFKAAGFSAGDEFITSPFVPMTAINALVSGGLEPVFIDIDPVSWNIDSLLIEKKITEKTKGIYAVHTYGQVCEMEAIMAMASKYNLSVIENASYAYNALYGNKKAGSMGHFSVFGFGKDKQLTTINGGIVLTNDKTSQEYLQALSLNGYSDKDGEYIDLGFDCEMDEMSAVIGLQQLKNFSKIASKRAKLAELYVNELEQVECIEIFPELPGTKRIMYFFVIRLAPMLDRTDFINKLRQKGISAEPGMPCVHLQPYYSEKYGYKEGKLPVAETIATQTIKLPFYSSMKESDVLHITETLVKLVKSFLSK